MSKKEVFTNIYRNNLWGSAESFSGSGSEIKNTAQIRKDLEYLIDILDVKSILDIPCGDMNWMRKINLENVNYEGWDIVEEIIEKNKKSFSSSRMNFYCKDVLQNSIGKFDLIICKDLLIHFPLDAIWNFLEKICASKSKYFFTTKIVSNQLINQGAEDFGLYNYIDFEKPPFNFPRPLFSSPEGEINKFMILYKIEHLIPFIKNHKKI